MVRKKKAKFFTVGLVSIALLSCSLLFCQEIDPFYSKLLRDGEKLFLAQNFKEAVKTLEIAAFGLHREKKLRGKAYVYLSLSFYHLKNYKKCEEYLRKAAELVEKEGFQSLEIDESIRSELYKLFNYFRIEGWGELPEAGMKIRPTQVKGDADIQIRELEKSIKAEPHNIYLYYILHELHRKNNNLKEAKKVLQNLVKNNPNEVDAYYLLARIYFEQRKFKDASKNFEQILKLPEKAQIKEDLLLKTKVSLILCFYYRQEEKKIRDLIVKFMNDFSEEKISSLALEEKDKRLFLQIIDTYRAQAAARQMEIRIKELEKAIKKEPRNTSLYYELYDLHRKKRNDKDAKKLLKNLVKNNPDEYQGTYLLAKIEFSQKKYKDALKYFNQVLKPSEGAEVDNELVLKSSIYVSLCLFHLNRREHLESFVRSVEESIAEEKLKQILQKEGLEEEWGRLKESLGE